RPATSHGHTGLPALQSDGSSGSERYSGLHLADLVRAAPRRGGNLTTDHPGPDTVRSAVKRWPLAIAAAQSLCRPAASAYAVSTVDAHRQTPLCRPAAAGPAGPALAPAAGFPNNAICHAEPRLPTDPAAMPGGSTPRPGHHRPLPSPRPPAQPGQRDGRAVAGVPADINCPHAPSRHARRRLMLAQAASSTAWNVSG